MITQSNDQAALIDLLYRLADDELFIGHRNSEWTGVAPILEEDIAFSSMAQDEMGHALAYYTILHQTFTQDRPDQLAFVRPAKNFRNAPFTALPRQDWAHAILRQFLYDSAEQVRLEHYTDHPFAPLAQLAHKFRGEEKYHFLHARTWVTKLGNSTEDSHVKMQAGLNSLWPYALGLFEPGMPDQPAQFSESRLREQWLQLVVPILLEAGLQVNAQRSDHDQWETDTVPVYGRYAQPGSERLDLLAAMQQVFTIDPEAQW